MVTGLVLKEKDTKAHKGHKVERPLKRSERTKKYIKKVTNASTSKASSSSIELAGAFDSSGNKLEQLIEVSSTSYNLVKLASQSDYDAELDPRRDASSWDGDPTSHALRQRRGDLNEELVASILKMFEVKELVRSQQFSPADDLFGVDIAVQHPSGACYFFQVKGSEAGVISAAAKFGVSNIDCVNTVFVRSWNEEGPKELLKVLVPLMVKAGFKLYKEYQVALERKVPYPKIVRILSSWKTNEELMRVGK